MAIVMLALSFTVLQAIRNRNVHDLDFDLQNGARSNVNMPTEEA